ncbi:uncharacterized protein LOC121376128 [Gigantopelta aegis]|uniref:uncharacterized protein LOC121376128 n=1 Tax=Gigantopelta aegis TaxID=1735272 RepID=UPI001B88B0BF|nr:uncharacterized protein LOC121376128 [Gigantopelta aegis]
MKGISPEFNTYPLNIQKHMSQLAMYCKFAHNRVIVKKGFSPDGCYIVLSGTLVEKTENKKKVRELWPGSNFGEEDLICGCNRRSTVLTRTNVELFCIHKQDYRQIFNMAEDVSNPKNLEVCKQDVVFQHFPMHRLVENPGIWTIVKYK